MNASGKTCQYASYLSALAYTAVCEFRLSSSSSAIPRKRQSCISNTRNGNRSSGKTGRSTTVTRRRRRRHLRLPLPTWKSSPSSSTRHPMKRRSGFCIARWRNWKPADLWVLLCRLGLSCWLTRAWAAGRLGMLPVTRGMRWVPTRLKLVNRTRGGRTALRPSDVYRLPRSKMPARTLDTNTSHSPEVNFRIFGRLCFESRTRDRVAGDGHLDAFSSSASCALSPGKGHRFTVRHLRSMYPVPVGTCDTILLSPGLIELTQTQRSRDRRARLATELNGAWTGCCRHDASRLLQRNIAFARPRDRKYRHVTLPIPIGNEPGPDAARRGPARPCRTRAQCWADCVRVLPERAKASRWPAQHQSGPHLPASTMPTTRNHGSLS